MSLSAATLALMLSKGLSLEDVVEIAASLEAASPKSSAAERQRRYRERRNARDVTRDVTQPPEQKVSPTPLSKTQTPTPSPPKGGSVPTNSDFETFWRIYPRKVGKGDARKAFDRAWRKLPPFEEAAILCGGLERAKAAWTDPQFIPHPATWLNGERWNDEVEVARPQPISEFSKWLARKEATGR